MPDLSLFADFALRVGAVPPVPPGPLHGNPAAGTEKLRRNHRDKKPVPLVPPVPPHFNVGNDDYLYCAFEERAAIMEYDGELPRHEAEARAWQEVHGGKTGKA